MIIYALWFQYFFYYLVLIFLLFISLHLLFTSKWFSYIFSTQSRSKYTHIHSYTHSITHFTSSPHTYTVCMLIYTNIHIHDIHIRNIIFHCNLNTCLNSSQLLLLIKIYSHTSHTYIILNIHIYSYSHSIIYTHLPVYTYYIFLSIHTTQYTFLLYTLHSFLYALHIPFWTIHSL
jgi:hypothetical protein